MPALKSVRDEMFAQHVASGVSQSEAYRRVSGKTANANNRGDEYMAKRGMKERVAEIRAEAEKKCSLTREQFVESLVKMYQGKPGEASLDNELCDSLISRGQRHAVYPMKAAIATQLAKICGWEKPTEIRVEAGSELTGLIGRLYERGATLKDADPNNPASGDRS